MRNIEDLHPELQEKIALLKSECKKKGITIGISECLRTVAEQDALYAKGRTKPGSIVTNCKGSTYSSMHQWGVAFDFYLIMDVDKDGKTSDDAFNDSTGLFEKVGKIGQKIGLEWGGSWKSICDTPHFQLPDWGSTASRLKSTYGTFEKFKNTWKKPAKKVKVENDKETIDLGKKNNKLKGKYRTTANLNMRAGAGTNKAIITCLKKGTTVTCNGYYISSGGTKWLYCTYGKKSGYMSIEYLSKK